MDFYKCCNCGYNNNIIPNTILNCTKIKCIEYNKIKINNDKQVKVNKEILDIIIFL
jgi:hypothetical protein